MATAKRPRKSYNILESLKIVQFITKFNGFLPYSLDKSGQRIRLQVFSVVMAISHYVLFLICFILSFEENKRMSGLFFRSKVSYFVSLTYRFTNPSSVTFIFVISLLRKKHLKKSLEILLSINKVFLKLSIKLKYNKITNLTIIMISITVIYIVVYNVCNIVFFNPRFIASFPLQVICIIPYLSMLLYVLIFITFVYIIKLCLSEINKVN